MKRIVALLMAGLLVLTAGAALAQKISPLLSEQLKSVVAGKTFTVRQTGYAIMGEGEDAEASLDLIVCERDRFEASLIENLQQGDAIMFSNGDYCSVVSVRTEDNVIIVTSEFGDYLFYRNEDGTYYATNETDNPYWRDTISFEIALGENLVYRDASDPDKEPVDLGRRELMQAVQDGVTFDANNTTVTFDENGQLILLVRDYSPWN